MKSFVVNIVFAACILSVFSMVLGAGKPSADFSPASFSEFNVAAVDSDTLRYPFHDRVTDKYNSQDHQSPMYMNDPSNIQQNVEYDPVENQYNINENIGKLFYRNPSYMTFEEFREHEFNKSTGEYWKQRSSEEDAINKKAFAPKITINSVIFDRIFGGNTIDIRPQGSAELTFSGVNTSNKNPALPERQRSVTTFNFNEDIQMNVTANIGTKMKLAMNYNTKATFEFENKMKLEYTGGEDDIIKKIEAGNVTLPLNSQLIQGSQSLFGIKTTLQFGRTTVTGVFSQEKGKQQCIDVQSGTQTSKFDIKGDQYEANRHFFLSQYFREQYETALKDINQIRSGINITRIEVWVTNRNSVVGASTYRNIIALTDLGEKDYDPSQHLISQAFLAQPSDSANNLYYLNPSGTSNDTTKLRMMRESYGQASSILSGFAAQYNFTQGKNYEVLQNAKLLQSSEYTVNSRLGYISLNTELQPGQILAVSYEYTLNGNVYHVGELSTSGITAPNALYLKLLRSTSFNPGFYTWDLMMKNVYNLGAYSIDTANFRLDVLYQDDKIGGPVNFIPEGCATIKGIPLIKILGLDKLNFNGDPQPDGVFDFKDGITINRSNGRVYFPVLEPFGSDLQEQFCGDIVTANKFVYQELYDTTRTAAQQVAEKNKFSLRGTYRSSSTGSEIPLNAVNIPQGSVKVTAGGAELKENSDFTVDYTIGRVKIINGAYLKSNTPIKICFESNSLFNIQTKTLIGTRIDYYVNKDFTFGGTFMHLSERPLTQKVNIGDEPISNTMLGLDGTYRTDSRFITKMLDKLPIYDTKEVSSVTVSGEVADLIPGHSKAIGSAGTSYIDDFEGAITPLDIKNPLSWYLASTPQGQPDIFPEGGTDSLSNGFNRAKAAWYYVDPLFQHDDSRTPGDIDHDEESNNYVREVPQAEIFPAKSSPYGPQSITCTNLAFYPNERGQYNYDVTPSAVSAGLYPDGTLKSPEKRWGGMMRKLETNDFQNSNIEFIQFWMLDPFTQDSPNADSTGQFQGGDLYFNLGDISEDVLKDGNKCYENGLYLPNNSTPPLTGPWGKYPDPNLPQVGYQFSSDATERKLQDIGIDGLIDVDEESFYSNYLSQVAAICNPGAYDIIRNDPSADDYSYFQSNTYNSNNVSPLDRYKRYNGVEGNSPSSDLVDGYQSIGTNTPDAEDLNKDFTLENFENYFQYKVSLRPSNMEVGTNYITDVVEATATNLPNGTTKQVKWYQFKIPIQQPERTIGSPNLTFIQSIRMFLRGFREPVICRFAKLELLRSDWRKYNSSLLTPGEYSPTPEYPGNTSFDISYVSIEENSGRYPIPYVLPPGIDKERDISTTQLSTLNEQSLTMQVCDLEDGDSRAAYKNTQLDLRSYKQLKMFVHAEAKEGNDALHDGQMTAFIRLGSDYVDNYYEYEIPLVVTPSVGGLTADQIWPTANMIDINLDQLVEIKTARNNLLAAHSSTAISLLIPYTVTITNANGVAVKVTVKGSPNLSNVRSIMIGVRNPKDPLGTGVSVCGEVWVNELRLSDFNEQGGWATTARIQTKLADLGNMTLVGYHSTPGWGSIEKKVSERDKVNRTSYDFTTSLELGKFIPGKTGIKVPVFFEYAEDFNKPQYNPLDPDVILNDAIESAPPEIRPSIKASTVEYKQRKSINFTNVMKTKTGKNTQSHIYDVENLNFTYAYTEMYMRDYNTERSFTKTYNGIIGYNFNNSPKPVTPFAKSKALSSPFLKLIKDFNFYYAPTSLMFRTSLDRTYSEIKLRNNSGLPFPLDTTFAKSYQVRREYGINFDLTKSLKFEFGAQAAANIDEPAGKIDTEKEKDSVKTNLKNLGRLTSYHHTAKATYNVPLSKIPLVDWVTLSSSYGADYSWTTGSLAYDSALQYIRVNSYKNTIQNSQNISFNGNLTFTTLYNKVPYLKKINQPAPVKPQDLKPKLPKVPLDSAQKALRDSLNKKPSVLENVFKEIARLAMSVKTASFTYTVTNGILLPGFDPRPELLGQDLNYHNVDAGTFNRPVSTAPGWGFVFGDQRDIRPDAIRYQWMSRDTALNNPYITTHLDNLSARATIEPVKSFKIELTAIRNYALSHQEYFRIDTSGEYRSFSPTEAGNFSMSYFTWNTAFIKDNKDYSNATFQKFSQYRSEMSQLLAARNANSIGPDPAAGYKYGYGPTQQEVLTSAFLAAYGGKNPNPSFIEKFPKIPLPNWKVTYDGLSKMKFFQKFFNTITFSHGYRSMYSINSFTQNLLYREINGSPSVPDTVGNFIPRYDYQQVTIAEQMAPLIGIDMTWKNSLQTRFEMKRDRTLSLSYANIQLTEVRGVEYTLGLGYKIKKFTLPIRLGSGKKKLSSPLNLKADFSLRNNTTIIRKLVEGTNQPSAGTETISYKVSADYAINERFNVNAFFERQVTNPFVSTSYPNSRTEAGLKLRFTLAQ